MHRTTTTAALLVTVAVSALSGCVTVQRPPAPDPPPAPSRPSAPRPDGSTEPRVVQAPAREALEMVQPSEPPSPFHTTPSSAPPPHPGAAPSRPPADPQPRRTGPRTHVQLPPAVSEDLPRNADVCALGRRYGRWRADSPEAKICGSTYGR
ncbi:hypothetical protein [Streptomyces chiangmaiensis]|uniref:Lipoprotein n=1 Tax=Streptomyces chiangmaiensis TaxID=766497 RepID=A0ABU7FEE0_9ACTN|nr:hypothetical protein [Streptomyces chiangmaiensis]MED7822265.1 hypothetical protein [Streptomyces chiangmaiensis]